MYNTCTYVQEEEGKAVSSGNLWEQRSMHKTKKKMSHQISPHFFFIYSHGESITERKLDIVIYKIIADHDFLVFFIQQTQQQQQQQQPNYYEKKDRSWFTQQNKQSYDNTKNKTNQNPARKIYCPLAKERKKKENQNQYLFLTFLVLFDVHKE
mmetsp:Transcript_5071/g.6404  ORF Transcript_5071/g.6404 Transcript_5071/m.6404 type:complete len:153 (-) Transcript_5071:96-554(-)